MPLVPGTWTVLQTLLPSHRYGLAFKKCVAAHRRFTSHTAMTQPTIQSDRDADGVYFKVSGDLLTQSLSSVEKTFSAFQPDGSNVVVDLTDVHALDTGGAWLVADLARRVQTSGAQVHIQGVLPAYSDLIETVSQNIPQEPGTEADRRSFTDWVESIGKRTVGGWNDTLSMLEFLGLTLHRLVRTILMPHRLRRAALVSQMEENRVQGNPYCCPDGVPDRRRSGISGRDTAKAIRSRDFRGRTDLDLCAERAWHSADCDHCCWPVRISIHGLHRLDEGSGRNRRHADTRA